MAEIFENRNLAGAVFRRVNLAAAVFDDVNLAGASIRDANLQDVTIDEANITGLTVFGFCLEELIEAEMDRRYPERAGLRMADPHDPASVLAVVDRLAAQRQQFCQALRAADPARVTARPDPDNWSAVEIVRHLIFAADLYLNRWILRNDAPWHPLGLLPSFLVHDPAYAGVGRQPSADLDAILTAWEALHRGVRAYAASATRQDLAQDTSDRDFGQGTVGRILQGLALHEWDHLRDARALTG